MLNPTQVSNAISGAKNAFAIRQNAELLLINTGNIPLNEEDQTYLRLNIIAMMYQVNRGDYSSAVSQTIYSRLISLTGLSGGIPYVDPNYQPSGNTIIIQTAGNFAQSGRIAFGPTPVLTITNWPTLYYPTYGDNPEIQVYTWDSVESKYQLDEQTLPVPVFPSNDITQRLQSISWTWGIPTQGYYVISGKKPSS